MRLNHNGDVQGTTTLSVLRNGPVLSLAVDISAIGNEKSLSGAMRDNVDEDQDRVEARNVTSWVMIS